MIIIKKYKKLTVILIVLIVLLSAVAAYFFNSPEYAMIKIRKEIKETGFAAIEQNLTQEAFAKLEPIIKVANNKLVSSILSKISKNEYTSVLIQKAKEIDWSVDEIIKNHHKASVTIRFNYDDTIVGTIDIELLRIDGKWRINNMYNLNVDKFLL